MSSISRVIAGGVLTIAIAASAVVAYAEWKPDEEPAARQVLTQATPSAPAVPKAAVAPRDLPEISYWHAASGFPQDPTSHSVQAVTEGLRPDRRIAVYDAPGGEARAFLPRSIAGMPVRVPIVERRPGWLAVLMPSINRRLAWVPETAGQVQPLRDQLVVDLSDRQLTWLRNGRPHQNWTVAIGSPQTPTPLGRTFVMGRTATAGKVYAGLDALVLGAIPDDRKALPASLRAGHTAIHAWTSPSAFGRNISNGCIRVPPKAQRTLLRHLPHGVVLTVVE